MTRFLRWASDRFRWYTLVACLSLGGGVAPLSAQSIVAGELGGSVTDEGGVPIRDASVTLIDVRSQIARATATDRDGLFGFDFVRAGTFDLRVESLGYRPLVIEGVAIGSGQRTQLPMSLTPATPPVIQVDTLRWGSGELPSAATVIGRRVRNSEVQLLPDLRRSASGLVALSSIADGLGGVEGLPGSETVLFSEGEAFRAARNPYLLGDRLGGLPFPRLGVTSASVGLGLDDIEWSGSAGGVVTLESRSAEGETSAGGYGLWSSDALFSSDLIADPASATSVWGGVDLSFPIVPDTALLAISVEGMRLQTPLLPNAADSLTADLLGGEAPPPEQPGVDETFVLAGTAKADWSLAGGGHITARAGFASFKRETDRLGTVPLRYGAPVPAEGTDGSITAVVGVPVAENLFLEVRGGVGFSSRDYLATDPDLPGAWVVGSNALLGADPAFAGSFSRLDIGFAPVLHYRTGPHRAKFGLRLDLTSYDNEYVEEEGGSFVAGDPTALEAGQGSFLGTVGSVPATTFSVPRLSAFGQYRWSVLPGLDLTAGARFEQESLPTSDVRLSAEWLAASGLRNDLFEERVNKVDARIFLRWDLQNNGRTFLVGGLAVQNGQVSPSAINEVLTLDGPVRVQRGLGDVGPWPSAPDSASAPAFGQRLALFGPDLKAPQTSRGSLGVSTVFGDGVVLSVAGSFRRTEFLLRRVDLNRTSNPVGADQDGRPVFGPLEIVGGVLGADPELNRRFPTFESVWALNSDGWSEYQGITATLESNVGSDGSLTAQYTYSETTDNQFGLLGGRASAAVDPGLGIEGWEESISDLDVPHRFTVAALLPLPFGTRSVVGGVYRYRSGMPFTPMVSPGLDANGDGSAFNDVAFIPTSGVSEAAAVWDCVAEFQGAFPERNSCRGDAVQTLDLTLVIGLGSWGGRVAQLVVDAFNVTDQDLGLPNPALLLVDDEGVGSSEAGVFDVPYSANSGFGTSLPGSDIGRVIRVGLRIGGGS